MALPRPDRTAPAVVDRRRGRVRARLAGGRDRGSAADQARRRCRYRRRQQRRAVVVVCGARPAGGRRGGLRRVPARVRDPQPRARRRGGSGRDLSPRARPGRALPRPRRRGRPDLPRLERRRARRARVRLDRAHDRLRLHDRRHLGRVVRARLAARSRSPAPAAAAQRRLRPLLASATPSGRRSTRSASPSRPRSSRSRSPASAS